MESVKLWLFFGRHLLSEQLQEETNNRLPYSSWLFPAFHVKTSQLELGDSLTLLCGFSIPVEGIGKILGNYFPLFIIEPRSS